MNQPRTVFDNPDGPSDDNFQDQITWFTTGSKALFDMTPRSAGDFNRTLTHRTSRSRLHPGDYVLEVGPQCSTEHERDQPEHR